jgi:ribosomal protein S1
MKLEEGVNVGNLSDADIFDNLTNKPNILKIKTNDSVSSLNDDYRRFAMEIVERDDQFKDLKEGQIIEGEIISLSKKEIILDIGYKDYIYIENKLSDIKIIENLKIGDNIDVIITKISDNPFSIKGSITDIIRLNVSEKLKDYYNDNKGLLAIVKEMMPAGFLLDIEIDNIIINAFMPTTLAGINKLTDQQKDDLIGKKIYVMLETLQQDKGVYVVSRRKYLQSLIKDELQIVKESFDKNKEIVYEGFVTGTQSFGVFVEFNECLTGMIHRYNIHPEWNNDKNWKKIVPGMKIDFYIKDIILKRKKIILTQILRESLWDNIKKDKIFDGKVIDIKPFGALIQLDDETNGLIQNSYLQKNNVKLKIGDNIKVRVVNIIKDDRKIYLTVQK